MMLARIKSLVVVVCASCCALQMINIVAGQSDVDRHELYRKATQKLLQKWKADESKQVQANHSELNLENVCQAAYSEMKRREIGLGPNSNERNQPHSKTEHPFHFAKSGSNSKTYRISDVDVAKSDSKTVKHTIGDQVKTYSKVEQYAIDRLHANCFDATEYPAARDCQPCHPGHYREWSVSPHAYAQLSPVFNAMSTKLIKLTNGTLGDFCIRCHTPVGMNQEQPIVMSNLDRSLAEREGVTCIVCHRANQNWGKVSGRQALVGGGLDKPIYGPTGNKLLAQVLANPDRYGVLNAGPDRQVKGRQIHREAVPFFALQTSAVCGKCHDVFGPDGFRLEDAFSEFKSSPAAKIKHQKCQDCHMGKTPGVASGYAFAPAAIVGNALTPKRKRTNHMMIGPDYSIVHPGIFPHNPKAVKEVTASADRPDLGLATLREWLEFDYAKGWGTQAFESNVSAQYVFPTAWQDKARRVRARDILNDQFELLDEASMARHQLLSTGYRLGNIIFQGVDRHGLHFKIKVCNGTDGHGVPTGFDAERLVFLRTTVFDRNGKQVFVSGDLDPNGDVRDSHSAYVHNGKLPLDRQLFSLQTRFLTRNIRGGEREQILVVPYSLDPLPYVRPQTRPFTVLGRPVEARKHKQNIEVGGHRWAKYTIKPSQLTGSGPYYAQVELIAGMVPVNLVHEISSVGFDYNMSAREVADAVVNGHVKVHTRNAILRAHE